MQSKVDPSLEYSDGPVVRFRKIQNYTPKFEL